MALPITRPYVNHQELTRFPYDQAAESALTSVIIWGTSGSIVREHRISRVWYNNPTGFATSNTAYWVITLTDGTNTLASWSTKTTGGQGTLTANTPVELVLATSHDLGVGLNLTLTFTPTGSPANLPAGRFVVDLISL